MKQNILDILSTDVEMLEKFLERNVLERAILKRKLKRNELENEILSKQLSLLKEETDEITASSDEKFEISDNTSIDDIPIQIILLERDAERVEHVNNHILKQLPKAKIFPAIDYKTSDLSLVMENLDVSISEEFKAKRKSGQLACFLSHMSLWKKMVEENISEMIILEDDALIPDNFYSRLNAMKTELPEDYDILYLFVHPLDYKNMNDECLIPGKENIVKRYSIYGTVAYLISLKVAKYLLDNFKIITITVDNQLSSITNDTLCFNPRTHFVLTAGQSYVRDTNYKFKSNIWDSPLII